MQHTKSLVTPEAPLLQVWDKLELVFEEQGKQGRYQTRIEDIDGQHILINRPNLLTGDALFRVGAFFSAIFIKPDSAYTFTSAIVSKGPGPIETYWVDAPRRIDRNQRRRFYRIETNEALTVVPIGRQSFLDTQGKKSGEFAGLCLNLSGNGLLVRTKLEAPVGCNVLITLKLRDYLKELSLVGVIRRREDGGEGWRCYGIEFFTVEEIQHLMGRRFFSQLPKRFLTFDEKQRTLLLNHIFARQLALKRKGLV